MMQTISLELSKKLKELGVKQEGCFYWTRDSIDLSNKISKEYYSLRIIMHNVDNFADKYHACSAFTLDEILEMLPVYLKGHPCAIIPEATVDYELKFKKENNYMTKGYSISYHTWRCLECDKYTACNKHFKIPRYEHKNNPAEAAGQLLKWCIENGYIKPENI